MKDTGIMLIEKSAKQNIWMIREGYPIYATRKNLYTYDFAVIAILGKDGSIRKYSNSMENVHIFIGCQRIDDTYHMEVRDMVSEERIIYDNIDSIFIYFEKNSQAMLAFTTAETVINTGFFMNTVSNTDIPSLREEAMSIAYMMDRTRSVFQMFVRYNALLRDRKENRF